MNKFVVNFTVTTCFMLTGIKIPHKLKFFIDSCLLSDKIRTLRTCWPWSHGLGLKKAFS